MVMFEASFLASWGGLLEQIQGLLVGTSELLGFIS